MAVSVLDAIALKYGTDKGSSGHGYCDFYERLFAPLRDQKIKVVEIGIGSDTLPSLRLWRDYFPLAQVFGIDSDQNKMQSSDRIITKQGDQSSREFQEQFAKERGPFHLVLDDGSHQKEHQLLSFDVFKGYMAPDGFYVCEDQVNQEVAEFFGKIAVEVTRENGDYAKYKSLSFYKGTIAVEFR